MEITCQHCKSKNEIGATYCHSCGKRIEGTIMDLYPNYKFVPASLKKIKGRSKHWLWLFLFILFILNIFCFMMTYSIYGHINSTDAFFFCGSGCFICSIIVICTAYQFLKPTPWKSVADYVQDEIYANYVFFVKGKKFGAYNQKKRKIQIPAEYDFLSWKQYDQVLVAIKDGQELCLDINNNVLT